MRLVITIKQPTHKLKKIETVLGMEFNLSAARQIFETEKQLNSIPGSDIKWTLEIEE